MAHAARSHSEKVHPGGVGESSKNDLADFLRIFFGCPLRTPLSRAAVSSTRRSFLSEKISPAFCRRNCDHRRMAMRASKLLRPVFGSMAARVAWMRAFEIGRAH